MNSIRLVESKGNYYLPIVGLLILGLVVVHQVGPKVEDTGHIGKLTLFRLTLDLKIN